MPLERYEVIGKGVILTPDEIVEGLQRPGVVDYSVLTKGMWPRRLIILTLWIDPEVRVRVETEIAELLQSVNDTYKEDTKHIVDDIQKEELCTTCHQTLDTPGCITFPSYSKVQSDRRSHTIRSKD